MLNFYDRKYGEMGDREDFIALRKLSRVMTRRCSAGNEDGVLPSIDPYTSNVQYMEMPR